jgi:hypothetical protein
MNERQSMKSITLESLQKENQSNDDKSTNLNQEITMAQKVQDLIDENPVMIFYKC